MLIYAEKFYHYKVSSRYVIIVRILILLFLTSKPHTPNEEIGVGIVDTVSEYSVQIFSTNSEQ